MNISRTFDYADMVEIFGPRGGASDDREWVRHSPKRFVRTHTGLSQWIEGARGLILTAFEAYEAFGPEVLHELLDRPVVPIIREGCEPAAVLREARQNLNVSTDQLARQAGVATEDVETAEAGRRRMPMQALGRIAQALALEPSLIGVAPKGGGDSDLGVRLRELQGDVTTLSPTTVLGLAEAAWIIRTQSRLERWIDSERTDRIKALGFEPIALPIARRRPAWREGIDLAHRTRRLLGLDPQQPIHGLLKKIEIDLSIPVVQIDLASRFAGATIAHNDTRGIAVNMQGINANVWVRRMTVAHELGHLLWDPNEYLNKLRVDKYEEIQDNPRARTDAVEMRANAFAAEFLAPQQFVAAQYQAEGANADAFAGLMEIYGISGSALSWQIQNGSGRKFDAHKIRSNIDIHPSDIWRADEGQNTDYFPLRETPAPRTGRFAYLCLEAARLNLLSIETVADYLKVNVAQLLEAMAKLRDLYNLPSTDTEQSRLAI